MSDAAQALARVQEASFARAAASTRDAFPPERRMDGYAIVAFLGARRWGVLATVRPDGRPHAATVGYALVGDRFVFPTLGGAARVRNLRGKPHASFVVADGEGDRHGVVIVEGTARLLAPLEAALEMRAPFRDASGALPAWIELLIVLTPERLLSYGPR